MGLSEAASATGVNRSTLFRAYKSGRMSATRTDTGQIEVDPAELFRVFPPIASQQSTQGEMHHAAQANATDDNALRASALEVEVKMLREMLDTCATIVTPGESRRERWLPHSLRQLR